ncbi:hypothetical protein D6D01_00074 [Aureobasidium pullulans]|uniref:uracil phosphoribosyltransferase n=1 Tax=Aureobasidium pullulans TaxID=5580 RepID=A0A4S9M357_AURPU|nr:hypothetical protein D6D01_00074 [Aureobasidium pullulans]
MSSDNTEYASAVSKANSSDHRQTRPDPRNLVILPSSNYLLSNLSVIRDAKSSGPELTRSFKRVAAQIIAQACDYLPVQSFHGVTPTESAFEGVWQTTKVCGVSVLRAGASFEEPLREAYNGPLSFGKILIQRDEKTCLPSLLYSKFPPKLHEQAILILEPILATGGSICAAIDLILRQGVPEHNIIIINLITSRRALEVVFGRYRNIRIITAAVDERLNSQCQLVPGVGDFGDRFYGTE